MTLIDQFTSAYNATVSNNFPVNARVLLFTIIGEWNRQRRPGEISLTYASMSDLSGIPRGSIYNSLKFLKDRNIIKIRKARGGLIDISLQLASDYQLKSKPLATEKVASNSHARKPEIKETEGARVQEEKPILQTDKAKEKLLEMYGTTNLAEIMRIRKSRQLGD